MIKLYAVGWQAGQGKVLGKLKNFREVVSDDLEKYISNIKFATDINSEKESIEDKFDEAIVTLQNIETNGNNTEVPFFRLVTHKLTGDYERIKLISEQIDQTLPKLNDFKNIRLYMITHQIEETEYRYFLKALRTATLKSRFIATQTSGKIKITDLENEGKSMPFVISYAEKITNESVIQYIFDVQDYEIIFGLNESKMKMAKENYSKFLSLGDNPPEYKISGEYKVEVSDSESKKIEEKLKSNRKLINMLSKYSNEAEQFKWEYVIKANELSQMFSQTPFQFDEGKKTIMLTAESLEAFVSVITNAKKLGIAKNEYEDATAYVRRSS
ncbi:TPA: hypothetical protein TXI81_000882 [Streptococcus suis]|nr:hypothetical protein [Streptococcus suis]